MSEDYLKSEESSPLRVNGQKLNERVLLVARFGSHKTSHWNSLKELARLVETAGGEVVGEVTQERDGVDSATYIGAGKAAELAEQVKRDKIQLVVFDHELSPSQNRNLEKLLNTKVLDRTGVILDIFAKHASTREGKLQVELAQLNYLMPRLVGQVSHWSRLAGGIGTLGPGETLLEMERRRLRRRITHLKRELDKVKGQRDQQRKRREKVPMPLISLVGYTNAGKSSLMNQLTEAGVLVEDALFATLDPTVRKVRLPSGRHFLLADTVGFVSKLPHQLIEAFRATLREIGGASLLLHVIDTPQPQLVAQVKVVEQVLDELGFAQKPLMRVFNKMDLAPEVPTELCQDYPYVKVSAHSGSGIEELLEKIDSFLSADARKVVLTLPYEAGNVLNEIYRSCRVLEQEEHDGGIRVIAELGPKFLGKFAEYIE